MTAAGRPLPVIPPWIVCLLGAALATQVGWQSTGSTGEARTTDLPPAPSALLLRIASFGEPELAARVTMLYLQAFDLGGDNALPYQRLDYGRLVAWLRAIMEADPRSDYALFSAARIYAENPDPGKCRTVLEFVHAAFLDDPDRRWPWLAHAALLAKHRMRDLPLALAYARAIDQQVRDPRAPLWAKQMQVFILEDMNELEAAKVMLGGLIASGRVVDASELSLLRKRLHALERMPGQTGLPAAAPSIAARQPI